MYVYIEIFIYICIFLYIYIWIYIYIYVYPPARPRNPVETAESRPVLVVVVMAATAMATSDGAQVLGRGTKHCEITFVAPTVCSGRRPRRWRLCCCRPCLVAMPVLWRRVNACFVPPTVCPVLMRHLALFQLACMSLLPSTATPLLFSTWGTAPLIASSAHLRGSIPSRTRSPTRWTL